MERRKLFAWPADSLCHRLHLVARAEAISAGAETSGDMVRDVRSGICAAGAVRRNGGRGTVRAANLAGRNAGQCGDLFLGI